MSACVWCKDGYIAPTGIMCRSCHGSGRRADQRHEAGARWERHGRPLVVARGSCFQGMPWVHFAGLHEAFECGELTEANGWKFIGPTEVEP